MKKEIISFILLCMYVLGSIGGFGNACYCGAYPTAIAIVVLAYMAWPSAKTCWENLTK